MLWGHVPFSKLKNYFELSEEHRHAYSDFSAPAKGALVDLGDSAWEPYTGA